MRRRSAILELTLMTVFVMAAVLSAMTWLSLRWQRAWLLKEVERGLLLTSDTLQSSLRQGMMQNQREEIRSAIERITLQTPIERIRLIEHRGRITMSTDRGDPARRLELVAVECRICHRDAGQVATQVPRNGKVRIAREESRMRAFTPVLAEPRCINAACHQQDARSRVLGLIDVSLSLRDVERDLSRNQATLAGLSLGTVLAGAGLIGLTLGRRFRRPMNDLMSGIRQAAGGDLDHRIPERSADEFGEMARSFNAMSRQLSDSQQSLIRSERLISMGKLAAGVAHEINNPLTGILSYAESLMSEAEPDDPRRQDYAVIVHETLRCRQIVRSLLEFARQGAPSFVPVRPGDLIEKAVNVLIRQAAFRDIRFDRRLEPGLPEILADPVQIEQVLINLIVNAQEAMSGHGTIVLSAERAGETGHVRFAVGDEGSGIPPEIRPRIFDPFFSTKGGKTDGLGLAVCLGIVQQHGGTIDFQCEPGRGTVFQVTLPVSGPEGRAER